MKSLRFSIRNYQLAGILYLQELILFGLFFIPTYVWLSQATGKNFFAYDFTFDFFAEKMSDGSALLPFAILVVLVTVSFVLLRIFLMGGIFEALLNQYSGIKRFWYDAAHHFRRFFYLFLLYSIPLLILTAIVSKGLGKLAEDSPNQMMPVTTMAAGRILAIVLSILFSYWHTAARFRSIIEEKLRLAFRLKAMLFLRFLGYQFLSVLVLSGAMLGGLLMLPSGGIVPWLGLILIQLGFVMRDFLKVASYKVLS